MIKKIGIFSGTFDPVHLGHIDFALAAAKACGLDKVFLLVEPRPRRKQGVRAFEHRQRMVELAIKSHNNLGSIILEQSRFTAHETLPVLQARFKGAELHMLMGDDMLLHLGDWPHVDELLKNVGFIIGLRQQQKNDVAEKIKTITKARGIKLQYQVFDAPHSSYASSKIRLGYKRGQEPEGLLPAVRRYIDSTGLYASDSASSK